MAERMSNHVVSQVLHYQLNLKKYQDLKIDLSEKQITLEQVLRRDRNRPPI